MREVFIMALVFFLMTGFKWGSSSKKQTETPVVKPTYEASVEDKTSKLETTERIKESRSIKQAAKTDAKVATAEATVPSAVSNQASVPSVAGTLKTTDPGELKQRVESLTRVARALRALNQAKTAE